MKSGCLGHGRKMVGRLRRTDVRGCLMAGTDESYGTAQICLNGHVISSSVKEHPKSCQTYCDICGAKAIEACPNCEEPIRGTHYISGPYRRVFSCSIETPPSYCGNCGQSFPWTETALQSAVELLAEELQLSEEETAGLNESVSDAIRETPRATLGATRIRRLLQRAGEETVEAVRDILVGVLSEAMARTIFQDAPR